MHYSFDVSPTVPQKDEVSVQMDHKKLMREMEEEIRKTVPGFIKGTFVTGLSVAVDKEKKRLDEQVEDLKKMRESIEKQRRLDVLNRWADKFPEGKFHCLTLFEVCSSLRMAVSGAADPWSKKDVAETVTLLKERLEVWTPSSKGEAPFDEAVKALVKATIEYAEGEGH